MTLEQAKDAEQTLPTLKAIATRLLELTDSVGSTPIQFGDPFGTIEQEDEASARSRYGFMILAFISKQDEHLRSVMTLIEHGHHRDATLIARAMSEGLAQLLWASHDKNRPEKPDLWFRYAIVEDWRQVQRKKADGVPVDPEEERLANRLIREWGPDYYSVKAKKKLAAGKALPADPYRRQWHDANVADIFGAVKGMGLYDHFYRPSSDWSHSSPRSILLGIDLTGEGFRYRQDDSLAAARALTAGIPALLQPLELLNNHFQLGLDTELTEITGHFDSIFLPTLAMDDEEDSEPA